jgi:hypothetical protein
MANDEGTTGSGSGADQLTRYKGFTVRVSGVDESQPDNPDSNWLSIEGGAWNFEVVETTTGGASHQEYTVGKSYVTELIMRGYMTPTRMALATWLQNSAIGKGDLRANVEVTPLNLDGSPSQTHVYSDCLISRIEIPSLNVNNAEPIIEECYVRPERYEVM